MIRAINRTLSRETPEEQCAAGRYNPGLVATYRAGSRRFRVPLAAGYDDFVDAYKRGDCVYFVTIRRSLGYCGVECFLNGEPAGDVFLQADHDVASVLGRDESDYAALDRLSDRTVAKRLIAYVDEVCC